MLENFKNLYEVRKTVRFELKPYKKTREILKGDNNYQSLDSYIKHIKHIKDGKFDKGFDWNNFCLGNYESFLEDSRKYFQLLKNINIEIGKENKDKSKKQVFFDFKKSKNIFKNIPSLKKIQGFEGLKSKLLEIQDEYQNYFSFFEGLDNNEHKNEKKSDISIHLRKIAYLNRNLLTIFNFFDVYKTDKEILKEYENIIDDNFEKLNNSIIASHENAVSGACFGKVTFNKFSLFRRETSLLKEKFETNKAISQKDVETIINDGDIIDDNGRKIVINMNTITSLKLEQKNEDLQKRLNNFKFDRSLDDVISELDYINGVLMNQYIQDFRKKYKKNLSIISVKFSQKINSKTKVEENNYSAKAEIILNGYSISIKPLQGQTLEGYQFLEEVIVREVKNKDKSLLVNKFLQILFKQKSINPNYNIIKEFRDTLAKYRGKLRQNVRTSEREFIQEAMVRYYSQILEKDGCYFVVLFDKNNLQNEIKNIVMDSYIKDKGIEGNYFKIYTYSQLSFSALEKLCLSKDGDLLINSSLQKTWNKYKNQKKEIDKKCELFLKNKQEHGKLTRGNCKDCESMTRERRERFMATFKDHILQALKKLKNDEKYKGEDWSYFFDDLKKQKSVEGIVSFINQKLYKLEEKYIDQDKIFQLADDGEILLFQIYSKDFNIFNNNFISDEENLRDYENNLGESQKIKEKTKRKEGKQENLFTTYFRNIFEKGGETFLGQEGGIFFRKANLESDKKRFRNDKFFISFDVIFNKGKDISKSNICHKKEQVDNNRIKEINRITRKHIIEKSGKIKDNIVFIGIDRGENEHLSFGFYDYKLNFQEIIGNTNFVEKILGEKEEFNILLDFNFSYIKEQGPKTMKELYSQIRTKHEYLNEKGEPDGYLELLGLKDEHIKDIFTESDENGNFYTILENGGRFVLLKNNYGYKIFDKDGNEMVLLAKNGNEVIDYFLLFQSERFKRVLDINSELKYTINMRNLKKGYISIIKDFFKKKISNLHKRGKEVIFVFENQTSNKSVQNRKKDKGASIISEIEVELINTFSYLLYKKGNQSGIQLSIPLQKENLNSNNKKYDLYGHFLFVNQDFTSSACPVCNGEFIKEIKENGEVIENENINKLFGHGKGLDFENSMHHINDKNNKDYQDGKWESGTINGKSCDYHMKNNHCGFDFMQSGDDLATYNIAKKAKEYLEKLKKNPQ